MKSSLASLTFAALSLLADAAGAQSFSFADSTFNLADYTITKFGEVNTITFSQILSSGNPGSALRGDYAVPPTDLSNPSHSAGAFMLNNSFVYQPALGGPESSFEFGIDKLTQTISGPSPGNGGIGFTIAQNGKFYTNLTAAPAFNAGFGHVSVVASLGDFALNTNGVRDLTSHPDPLGAMTFGLSTGYGSSGNLPAANWYTVWDNFTVSSVSAVPEPSSVWLTLGGLGVLLTVVRRRPRTRPSS